MKRAFPTGKAGASWRRSRGSDDARPIPDTPVVGATVLRCSSNAVQEYDEHNP